MEVTNRIALTLTNWKADFLNIFSTWFLQVSNATLSTVGANESVDGLFTVTLTASMPVAEMACGGVCARMRHDPRPTKSEMRMEKRQDALRRKGHTHEQTDTRRNVAYLRNEISLGDCDFLFGDVTGELDHLHTIA